MKELLYEEYDFANMFSLGLRHIVEGQNGVKAINVMPTQPFIEVRYDNRRYRDMIPLGNVRALRVPDFPM